ncbi:MAG: hypothetical protein WD875_11270 [Pirellulales bacterium]
MRTRRPATTKAAAAKNGKATRLAPADSPGTIRANPPKSVKTTNTVASKAAASNGRAKNGTPHTNGKAKQGKKQVAAPRPPALESRTPNFESNPQPQTPSNCFTPARDRQLVDRALSGQPGAWDALYDRCHQPLLAAIRAIIANRAVDPNLIDELAARVWYAVVRDEGRLLDRFDPSRGCVLTTYLALLAKDEASRLFRSERRRRRRETAVATSEKKTPTKNQANPAAAQLTLAEFAATLTPAEKTFYEEITVAGSQPKNGQDDKNGTEKANGAAQSNGRSQANEWQLNHRVRRKLERFLTG